MRFEHTVEKIDEKNEAIFICVGTPEKSNGEPELKYVYEAVNEIISKIRNDIVIVVKSTVPIGECDNIETYIKIHKKNDFNIEVVSNPEFLSQGTAIKDYLERQRIIMGANTEKSINTINKIYEEFPQRKLITTRKNAEMIKYVSNAFLALKISYINSIACLCEKLGADIQIVSNGVGMDERIGRNFLNAGIGYGGSCFPKDTKALLKLGEKNHISLDLVKDTILINEKQNLKLLDIAKKHFKSFKGMNIAILGLTFKPNTNDLREAPALKNIQILLNEGANITVYDPIINKSELNKIYKEIIFEDTIEKAIYNKDICFIFTEWEIIKKFDIDKYKELMKDAFVLDGRNCYEISKMKEKKIKYFSIGR